MGVTALFADGFVQRGKQLAPKCAGHSPLQTKRMPAFRACLLDEAGTQRPDQPVTPSRRSGLEIGDRLRCPDAATAAADTILIEASRDAVQRKAIGLQLADHGQQALGERPGDF